MAERQRRLGLIQRLGKSVPPSYSCPECRKEQFKEVEDLTRNFFIERAVENYDATKGQDKKDENICKLHNMPLVLCKCFKLTHFKSEVQERCSMIFFMFANLFGIHTLACNLFYSDCVTHKKKLCHECHYNKLCEKSGKKECQVLKMDEFEELVAKSMEEVDEKVQEAIDSITAHGKRIKNILKNDPVSNKIDENWKLNFQSKEMLVQERKEETKTEKKAKNEPKIEQKNESKISQPKNEPKKELKKETTGQVKNNPSEKKSKTAQKSSTEKKTDNSEMKTRIENPPKKNPSTPSSTNAPKNLIKPPLKNPSKNLTIQISNIEPDKTMDQWFAIKGEWINGKLQQKQSNFQSNAVCHVSFHHNKIREYFG